jgi:hypothetical protein
MRKLATFAAAAIAAAGIPLLAAAPAQAAPDYAYQCMKYLDGKGYTIGPKVQAACGDEILHCQQALQRRGSSRLTPFGRVKRDAGKAPVPFMTCYPGPGR